MCQEPQAHLELTLQVEHISWPNTVGCPPMLFVRDAELAMTTKPPLTRQWHPVPTAALATSNIIGRASISPQQETVSPPQPAGEERVNLCSLLSHHFTKRRTSKACSAFSMHPLFLHLLQGCFSPSRLSPCTLLPTAPLQPLGTAAPAPKLPVAVQTSCPKKNHYWLYPIASGRYGPSPEFYCQ